MKPNAGSTGRYSAVAKEIGPLITSTEPPTAPIGDVHAGKWRIPGVVALGVITAVSGYFTALAQRPPAQDPTRMVAESTAAQSKQREDLTNALTALDKRLTRIETKTDSLQGSVDALRDRVNDRLSVPLPRDATRDRINEQLGK